MFKNIPTSSIIFQQKMNIPICNIIIRQKSESQFHSIHHIMCSAIDYKYYR